MKQIIRIELQGYLKRYLPDDPGFFPIDSGSRVQDVVGRLNIPEHEVSLVFINGNSGNFDAPITGGDRIGIFPPPGD
jgi:hypothetical protein